MSNDIERLLFYEREYLRSDDFAAEQNYHMEMRRRLNLALHLYGIVNGLEIIKGPLMTGVPDQLYVSKGMAIDAYGREIVLFAPYAFSEDDLLQNRISQPGEYAVWIAYRREPSRPPSPEYRVCNLDYQYTRWRESAQILISNNLIDVGANPATAPDVTAALSDDPDHYPSPIKLGSIVVSLDPSNRLVFDHLSTKMGDRVYIGLRTQRIRAAVSTNPPDASLPIRVEADMQEQQNLFVGEYLSVNSADVTPPPPDPAKFSGPGNAYIGNNLFVKEECYKWVNDTVKWLALKEYIQTLIPDIVQDAKQILNPVTSDSVTITVTSNSLKSVSSAKILLSITGIEGDTITNIKALNFLPSSAPQLSVTPTILSTTGNSCQFKINWVIEPDDSGKIPVKSITVSYLVILYP